MNHSRMFVPMFVIAAFALVIILGPFVGAAVIMLGVSGVFLFSNPSLLLAAYLVLASVHPLLQMFGFPFIGYADEFLTVFMVISLFAQFVMRKFFSPALKPILVLALLSLCEVGLSFLVNRPSPIQAVHFIFTYYRFLPVFLLAYMYWNSSTYFLRLLKANLLFFAVQFVLSVTWIIGINPIPNPKSWYDVSIGTLGSCSYVAYYCIGMLAVVLERIRVVHRQPVLLSSMLLAVSAMVLLFLTLTIHAYLLALLLLGWWMCGEVKRRGMAFAKLGIPVLFVATIIVLALFAFSAHRYTSSIQVMLSTNTLRSRFLQFRYEPKGIVYANILRHAPREMKMPLVGAGPGNFSSAVGIAYDSPLSRKYVTYFYTSMLSRSQIRSGSISVYPYAGFLSIYGEIGPLGCLLYYGFYIFAFVHIWRQVRKKVYREPWRQMAAQAFLPICGIWVGISFIWDAFHLDYLCSLVWIIAAVAWTPTPATPAVDDDSAKSEASVVLA